MILWRMMGGNTDAVYVILTSVLGEDEKIILYATSVRLNVFPYSGIETYEEFIMEINGLTKLENTLNALINIPSLCHNTNIDIENLNAHPGNNDLDPDINLCNGLVSCNQYEDINSLKSKMKAHVGQNSVMLINCRSVNLKVDELILLLTQIPVTFLALSETWIDEDDTNTLTIPGYNTVSKPRKGRQGGGVALLIREDIIFSLTNLKWTLSNCTTRMKECF